MKHRQALSYALVALALLFFASVLAAVPAHVYAETGDAVSRGYTDASGLVTCSGTDCQACDVVSLLQKLINFAIGLTIPIAIGLFAYAGALYFTAAAKPANIDKAKGIFRSAIIGFVIVLGAYLMVETILHAVLNPQYFNGWNSVQCVPDNQRPTNTTLSQLLGEALKSTNPTNVTTNDYYSGAGVPSCAVGTYNAVKQSCVDASDNTIGSPTFTPSGGGAGGPIVTYGPDGTRANVNFATTRSVTAMGTTYLKVQSKYGSQINTACYGATFSNCEQVVTAVIVAESSGDPNAVSDKGAKGLMQSTANTCATSNTQCQINEGVRVLQRNYQQFNENLPNAFAAYNSGNSTTPGQSVSGKNSAMVNSVGCPGYYAYQCGKNPGGLIETQNYIANICSLLAYEGSSC